MPALRLMADHDCHPLWEGEAAPAKVDPASLEIPQDLAAALSAWADQYNDTLNPSDPMTSGFPDASAAQKWLRTGADLAARLRAEGLSVDYLHEGTAPRDLVAGD